ncbi:MAG: ATP synthase F1 subunit gamma [Clostridia bacterium]|jgi:F-type H+-transporting ATPase subunit gamma|nr:ATP synthase F1 subunit gamma [Clostridia bacterium]
MGADIKSLRIRIRSVDSTLHLTKAMGLVASSKIRRATKSMNQSRQYTAAMDELVAVLRAAPECERSPYMVSAGEGTRLIVIAGDRGLAGGYNANVFRLAATVPEAEILPIGRRACERYGKPPISSEHFSAAQAQEWADEQCRDFREGKFGKLGILFTRYRSLMSQEADILWVLPLEKTGEEEGKNSAGPIFEPDEQTVLNTAVPAYVGGVLTACIRESFASEVSARRMAMDSAGKNAQEMIDRLQLQYNRARQNSITQEITEIVAGSGL